MKVKICNFLRQMKVKICNFLLVLISLFFIFAPKSYALGYGSLDSPISSSSIENLNGMVGGPLDDFISSSGDLKFSVIGDNISSLADGDSMNIESISQLTKNNIGKIAKTIIVDAWPSILISLICASLLTIRKIKKMKNRIKTKKES